MRRRRLVIFVRAPRPGVKSRLAREIGTIDALWWYRHQCRRLLRRLAADPRWQTWLAVTPDADVRTGRFWPAGMRRLAQGPGGLGPRMARVLRQAPGDVLIVGSDIPAVGPAPVAESFALLGAHDAVLSPAADGGYWAIGLRAGAVLPAGALAEVRWSTRHALGDTLKSLAPLTVGAGPLLADVDRAADLAPAPRLRPG